MKRPAVAMMVAAILLAAGCAASPVPEASSAASRSGDPTAAVSPRPSAPSSLTPSATTSISPGASTANVLTTRCSDTSSCAMAAGTWVTAGTYGFLPGLSLTVPAGWSTEEADVGQLKLVEDAHPDDAVRFWKDVAAIESNGETPKVLDSVARTPDGLTASFRSNPDLVVSTPTETTIGGGVAAITYVIGVSPSAAYVSQGCPSYPTCANILKDPVFWGPEEFFAIGAPSVVRLYLATIGTTADPHMLVICLDATDPAALERLTAAAAPIIASLRLPAVIAGP